MVYEGNANGPKAAGTHRLLPNMIQYSRHTVPGLVASADRAPLDACDGEVCRLFAEALPAEAPPSPEGKAGPLATAALAAAAMPPTPPTPPPV